MAGFAKLFASITESSVWGEPHFILRVWIAMLAKSDADGIVEGSIPGFAHLCHVTIPEMEEAIAVLSGPDQYSRNRENDGRRIEPFAGGWRVLNFASYRAQAQAKEGSRAPYYRQYRAKKRAEEMSREQGDSVLPSDQPKETE